MRVKPIIITKVFVILIVSILHSCTPSSSVTVNVFAASSLQNVMQELAHNFDSINKTPVQFNFASSGILARQIEQGAQAQVFISANEQWANYLESKNVIVENSKQILIKNSLVLITPISSDTVDSSLNTLTELINQPSIKIAYGDPQYVPAGKYAKEAFMFFGMYKDVVIKSITTKDVRSALAMVEIGEADYGVVYKTDALKSNKVKIIYSFPQESHSQISYFVEQCSFTKAGADFYEFILAPANKSIWEKYGFIN